MLLIKVCWFHTFNSDAVFNKKAKRGNGRIINHRIHTAKQHKIGFYYDKVKHTQTEGELSKRAE